MIFVPTVKHTGTWFLLEFLKRNSQHLDTVLAPQRHDVMEEFAHWQRVVVHCHVGDDKANEFWPQDVVGHFASRHMTLMPMRDPLLSLLTCMARDKTQEEKARSKASVLNGLQVMAGLWSQFNIHILPVDLGASMDELQRYDLLARTLKHITWPLEPYVAVVAMLWSPVNTTGELNWYKALYYGGKVEAIQKHMPHDFKALVDLEPQLRPMLESVGYKNLMWWTS